jgi:hypothetical protein
MTTLSDLKDKIVGDTMTEHRRELIRFLEKAMANNVNLAISQSPRVLPHGMKDWQWTLEWDIMFLEPGQKPPTGTAWIVYDTATLKEEG